MTQSWKMPIYRNKFFPIFLTALTVLLLPLRWIVASILAALFHECCHIGAILLCGGNILRFSLTPTGAVIETESLSGAKALFCHLAGPIGSFLFLLIAKWMPEVAVFGFLQGAFNLLPLDSLDGGQAIKDLLSLIMSPRRVKFLTLWISRITSFFLIMIGILSVFVLKVGLLPLILAITSVLKGNSAKIPCKPGAE